MKINENTKTMTNQWKAKKNERTSMTHLWTSLKNQWRPMKKQWTSTKICLKSRTSQDIHDRQSMVNLRHLWKPMHNQIYNSCEKRTSTGHQMGIHEQWKHIENCLKSIDEAPLVCLRKINDTSMTTAAKHPSNVMGVFCMWNLVMLWMRLWLWIYVSSWVL